MTGFVLGSGLAGAAPGQVVISEILYDPVGADDGFELVELHNPTGASVDLTRWSVCVNNPAVFPNDRQYYAFASGRTIAAGAYLTVHWRAAGVGDATNVFTSSEGTFILALPSAPLDNTQFACGLFEDNNAVWSGAEFDNPAFIRDFVQVGGIDLLREPVAVAAGIWTDNDRVLDRPEGASLVYDGTGDASSDWVAQLTGFVAGDNGIVFNPSMTYGNICPGSGGFSAHITPVDRTPGVTGVPFQISLVEAHGGDLALILVGVAPDAVPFGINGCELAVAPPFLFIGPLPLANSGDGQGTLHLSLTNNNPGLGSIFITFLIADPGVQGLIATNGIQVVF